MVECRLVRLSMETTQYRQESGYSLVELMVVVAIVAILAAVAIPAYTNYVNRAKQSEAANLLLTSRIEMEEFYSDNNRYARTMGCLPSFADTGGACLANCATCPRTSQRMRYYTFTLENPSNAYYRIAATRKIYSYASTDRVFISSTTQTPVVANVAALKWSVYKWLFP
jgi:type IV pilus assembly protein PilE